MNPKRTLLQCALALAALPLAFGAAAQDFPPKKPVTLVVGFAAGGAADAGDRAGSVSGDGSNSNRSGCTNRRCQAD